MPWFKLIPKREGTGFDVWGPAESSTEILTERHETSDGLTAEEYIVEADTREAATAEADRRHSGIRGPDDAAGRDVKV